MFLEWRRSSLRKVKKSMSKQSKWQAHTLSYRTSTIHCSFACQRTEHLSTSQRIWAKYCVVIELWTHHMMFVWRKMSIANCCATLKIVQWHGTTNNPLKSSSAFDMNISFICWSTICQWPRNSSIPIRWTHNMSTVIDSARTTAMSYTLTTTWSLFSPTTCMPSKYKHPQLCCKYWLIIYVLSIYARDKYRIVRFEVETMSVNYNEIKFEGDTCNFPDSLRPQAVSVLFDFLPSIRSILNFMPF